MSGKKVALDITKSTITLNSLQQISRISPWSFTGPVSHSEWKDVPLRADQYRAQSPSSDASTQLVVPQSIGARIYNTRYYWRDVRRYNIYLQEGSSQKQLVSGVSNLKEVTSNLEHSSFPTFNRYTLVNILDDPNSGYT